jgi:hypothetical protein
MKLNLTVDNIFRNPFRWGRCKTDTRKVIVFGVTFNTFNNPIRIKKIWILTIYFYKWYRFWSNHPTL